jgi:hypothetical protein
MITAGTFVFLANDTFISFGAGSNVMEGGKKFHLSDPSGLSSFFI